MGTRCWPWDHQKSRTWQKKSPGLAQFDKEHFFGLGHKDRDFLQLDTRAAALGMQSYGRSYFCFLNVIFGCVSTEISIQFSTGSFPNRIEIFGLLNLSSSTTFAALARKCGAKLVQKLAMCAVIQPCGTPRCIHRNLVC